MKKLYFITGSQNLYGEETLNRVAVDSREMADYLNRELKNIEIEWQDTVRSREEAEDVMLRAVADRECVGVITWMHTFSPAKMWINGLKILNKPLLHLHTQYNCRLPYHSIDMDFMNLNQAAHGDREFGFICTRLGIERQVVSGYYKNESVVSRISAFADVALAIDFSKHLRVAMLGNNMRDVSVTDGDRVESEIKYGWSVNYYGVGDLVNVIEDVTESEIDKKMCEYRERYFMNTDREDSVREQARIEIALERFLADRGIGAFTDTFEDLHGMRQLPGLSVQNLMANGIGFGPEGDYKTSALMAVLCKMAEGREGATAFLEDYTYDLPEGEELELAAHMLEVSPVFASDKPKIEVHPLKIGNREAPARLVFDGCEGKGIAVSMVDMGTHFRLICADIELVKAPADMPNLPVARVMWKILPDFTRGSEAWIYAGGAHHAVISTVLTRADIELFAKLTKTEIICIG